MHLCLQDALVGVHHVLEVDLAVDDVGKSSVFVLCAIELICVFFRAIKWHGHGGNNTAREVAAHRDKFHVHARIASYLQEVLMRKCLIDRHIIIAR